MDITTTKDILLYGKDYQNIFSPKVAVFHFHGLPQ